MKEPGKITSRSIWFVSCIAIGLFLAYQDGTSALAIAKTALVAAGIFAVYLLAEAFRSRNKQT